MHDESLKYKIGISLIPRVGSVLAKKLVAYTGSIEGIFNEKKSALLKIPGVGEHLASNISNQNILGKAEKELEYIIKQKVKPYFYLDKNYPERLRHCPDAPVMLFAKGEIDFNITKVISIVGTRNATQYGRDICNKLIEDLALNKHEVIIVSGLAYGIDICAHKAALKNNLLTVAVLAHGLKYLYPPLHKTVAEEIINKGSLVTDFISDVVADKVNFVKRNRIIAGLSDATIVVESGPKGGALITADIANSYNRDVFAFPGKISDSYSTGCNRLIKSNKAALIEGVKDLEYIMGWDTKKINGARQIELFKELTNEEQKLIDIMKENPEIGIDELCFKANYPVSKVSSILLNLEFSGLVTSLPGKVYTIK